MEWKEGTQAHGIEPDTDVDMTGRIRAFIREELADGTRRFRFKPGVYEIADEKARRDFEALMSGSGQWDLGESVDLKNTFLSFEGMERIELDFQGSVLRFHGLIQPFSFRACKEVVIRNVRIDWARPLFSQGEIVAADENGLEIAFDPAYPVASGLPIAAMLDFVPGSAHPLRCKLDWFYFADRTELTGEQRVRISYKPHIRDQVMSGSRAAPSPGQHVVVRHVMNYKSAFLFYQCDNVAMENVTIYTAPGMGVIGHGCGDVTMRGLRVMRRPGSRNVLSTNTDATHFIGCSGTITFDDCLFEGMGDDATNVHGFYVSVREIGGDRSLVCGIDADIQSECSEIPAPGDRMELTRRATLKPYGVLTVRKAERLPNGDVEIQFEEDVRGYEMGDLLTNVSRMATLRFTNSIVRNNRARAILVQTRDAVIADNTFDHCTGSAIHVNCAEGWMESAATQDVSVTRNLFLSCGFGGGTYRGASALALMTESKEAEAGVHRGFAFTGNVVYGNGIRGVSLSSLDGGYVSGNRFIDSGENVHVDWEHCSGIVVD
ncbi:right-handed parallel beta-helix repeat-containing protein [Cohnella soli]|uniref:Right-handed parallel beta-helix repeat-containing protein n=1 Tax=Cohnella soli TaxID=425005 RepID=A0ABW0I758_9BACL